MGKGNIVLGMARGKIGDVVFYRALGQQQMRAYVGSNIDAKTDNQLKYRLRLPNILNAFKALKNPYSFEGARKDTNFYSRFMRANLNRAPLYDHIAYITKGDYIANRAVGDNYIISQGSLAPFQYDWAEGHVHWPWASDYPSETTLFPLVYATVRVVIRPGEQAPQIDSGTLYNYFLENLFCKGQDVTTGEDVGNKKRLTICQAFTPDRVFITQADYITLSIDKDPFPSAQVHDMISCDVPQIRAYPDVSGRWYLIVYISSQTTSGEVDVKYAIGRGFPRYDAPAQYVTTGFLSKVARDGTLKVSFSQFPYSVFYANWDILTIRRIHSAEGFEDAKESYGGGADVPFSPIEP